MKLLMEEERLARVAELTKEPDYILNRGRQEEEATEWLEGVRVSGINTLVILTRNSNLKQDLVSKYDKNDKLPIKEVMSLSPTLSHDVVVPLWTTKTADYDAIIQIVGARDLEENTTQIYKLIWNDTMKVPELFAKGMDIQKRMKDIPVFIKHLNHAGITLLFAKYKAADARLAIFFALFNPEHRGGLMYLYSQGKFAAVTEVTYILHHNN